MNRHIKLSDLYPIIVEQINAGGSTSFTIHGTSMQPLLYDGKSVVRLEKPNGEPKKYDIIFYRRDDGNFLLHRIVGVKKNGYICRGDNQTINEYPVKREWVIAVMTQHTENGRTRTTASLMQQLYARLWVNTVFIRKIKRKSFAFLKKYIKKDR